MAPRAGAYISAMLRPYPISTQIDGCAYKGDWQLLQGCRVYVRSAWGNEVVEAGCNAKFVDVARRTLERIVRADQKRRADWKAHQQRELAKLSRPRRTRRQVADDDDHHP